MAHPDRTPPPSPTAFAVRAAADLLGVIPLANRLDVAERTLYNWMSGKRNPPATLLPELRGILVEHRQKVGELIQAIRAVEDGRIVADMIHRHELEDLRGEGEGA